MSVRSSRTVQEWHPMVFGKLISATLRNGPVRFMGQVLSGFRRNQGMLLSGAVAYYTLLSIVPMFALMLVGLSHFMEEERLLETVKAELTLILPAYSEALTNQLRTLLANRNVIGTVGILVLLFFSSMAFTVLENAMSVIFFHRVNVHRRHFLVSAIIPYVYILLLGMGVLLVSIISGALQSLETETLELFGRVWSLRGASGVGLYALGLLGLVVMMTSLYLVMPMGRIALRHALIGGVTAALLWEATRHLLVWYFSSLSIVNVVYGSLAIAVVALLSFEMAAIIVLLGAQVIAEFERSQGGQCADAESGFQT